MASYIAQGTFNSNQFNQAHIRFTARNSEWIFNEMQGIGVPSSYCSTECFSPSAFRIDGPGTLCGSGTYSTPVSGPGLTYTWTTSPAGAFTNPGGTGATFTTSSNGTDGGTITLRVGGDCPFTLTKNVRVGGPETPMFDGPTELDCFAYAQTYFITNYSSGLTYTTRTGGVVNAKPVLSDGSFQVIVRGSGQGYVDVTASNGCGSTTNTLYINVSSCANAKYTAYPNPANDEVQVEQTNSSSPTANPAAVQTTTPTTTAASGGGITTVRLYDSYGQLRLEQAGHGNRAVRLRVGRLPAGPYILHVVDGEGVTSRQQLMIEH